MNSTTTVAISGDVARNSAVSIMEEGSEEMKVNALLDLSKRPEGEVAECLDSLITCLSTQNPELKKAVCKAFRAAGGSGAAFGQEFVGLLKDSDPEVQYEACITIAGMGLYGSGKDQIKDLLGSQNALVRFGAVTALGGLEATECKGEVSAMLKDSSPEVQGAACIALGKFGDSSMASDIAAKLREPRSRLQALTALASMEDAAGSYCEEICGCLLDQDAEIRLSAATVAGKLAESVAKTSGAMIKVQECLNEQDGRFRIAGALALGYMGKKGSDKLDALVSMVSDDFDEEAITALVAGGVSAKLPPSCRKAKCAAAVALGMICQDGADGNFESVASDIAVLLEDEDWEVRLSACEALGLMGDQAKDVATKVASLFDDDKFAVRAKAASACGKLGDHDTAGGLADLLDDKSPLVKEEACFALATMGDEGTEFIEKIYEKVSDPSPRVAAAAMSALGKLNEKGKFYAGAVANALLAAQYPEVRVAAIEALGCMEDHGAVYSDVLVDFLQDDFPMVREATATSLGKFGDIASKYQGAVLALADDPSMEVRKAADEAASMMVKR